MVRGALALALTAFGSPTTLAQPRTPSTTVATFEGTALSTEQRGALCGRLALAGAFRVRVETIVSGPVTLSEVRVVAGCPHVTAGRRYRITGALTTRRRGTWGGGFHLPGPLPADAIPTFWATNLRELPAGT